MLTMTPNAHKAIEVILGADSIPDGAGLRIAPPIAPDNAASPSPKRSCSRAGAAGISVALDL